MSTESIGEVVVEEEVDPVRDEMRARIRAQVDLSSALRDFLEATDKFERVSEDLKECRQALRDKIKPSSLVVVRMSYGSFYGKHYLVTTDECGNFDIDPVDVI